MLRLLGDEWTLLIVQRGLPGAQRYGGFATALPVSNAVLSSRLRSMPDDELLNRSEYQLNPPRSEYQLTSKSRSLWPMLASVWEWERRWVPDQAEALPRMHHTVCDRQFSPQVA